MDNQPWDKAKLADWKKFWESEMGVEAIKKMEKLKEMCLEMAQNQTTADAVSFYVGRAAGIGLVIQDIQVGIQTAAEATEQKDKNKPAE